MNEQTVIDRSSQPTHSKWKMGLAWLLLGMTLLLAAVGFGLFIVNSQTIVPASWGSDDGSRNALNDWITAVAQLLIIPVVSAFTGFLIVRRRPGQRIGWLLMAIGSGLGIVLFFPEWALYGHYTLQGPLFGARLAAWFGNWLWVFIFSLAALMSALIPDGRFLSTRWARIVSVFLLFYTVTVLVASSTQPIMTSVYQIANPYFESQSEFLYTALTASGTFSLVVTVLIGLASIITRFRRSKGRERQQIKWLMSGMGIMALSLSTGIVLSVGFDNHIGDVLVIMASFWPILAIGIALLRHRLYDIDVLIRRTLTYGILSAVLVLVYFGSVVVLQTVFGTLAGEQSPAVIVISTLVIAALFGTLRGRVQTIIDRRFFRQKYDAEQVLARFAERARDEVEMEALTAELLAVIRETMQPHHIGLWLQREPASGRRSPEQDMPQ